LWARTPPVRPLETLLPPGAAREPVKYVYCRSCDEVSLLATLEPERCQRCGKPAVLVPLGRSWQHWAAAGVILAGAVTVFLTNYPDILLRFALLGPFLFGGILLSTWGLRTTKRVALERGRSGAKE